MFDSAGVAFKVESAESIKFVAPFELGDMCGVDISPSVQILGRARKKHANEVEDCIRNIKAGTSTVESLRKEVRLCEAQGNCTKDKFAALHVNISTVAQAIDALKSNVDKLRNENTYDFDLQIEAGAYMTWRGGGGGCLLYTSPSPRDA